MRGILLLSHGTLCQGILSAMEVIGCDTRKIQAVPLYMETELEEYAGNLSAAIDSLDDGSGVLVVVDLVGGTPFNRACMLYETKNIRIIAGMNLPMCIVAAESRDCGSLDELVQTCLEGGRDGVVDVKSFLE